MYKQTTTDKYSQQFTSTSDIMKDQGNEPKS